MARKPTSKQFSFAGGEISPKLGGRTDLQRYRQSLDTCRNFLIETAGSAPNRPGTVYVAETKDSTKESRLIPFVALNGESYALEFGDKYMRIHTLGGTVQYSDYHNGTHTGGSGELFTMTDTTKNWVADQWVGATLYNVTDTCTGTVTSNTATTVTCSGGFSGGTDNDFDTNDGYDLFFPAGQAPVVEVVSPFMEADLFGVDYAQQNDVMFMTHPNYPPQVLRRYADDNWTIGPYTTIKNVNPPTALAFDPETDSAADATHPEQDLEWVVTSVDANGQESIPTDPLRGTFTPGAPYTGSDWALVYPDKNPNVLEWTAPTDGNAPVKYNVYRGTKGFHGYIGSTDTNRFTDSGFAADLSDGPPQQRDPSSEVITIRGPGDDVEIEFASGLITTVGGLKDAVKTSADESANKTYIVRGEATVPPLGSISYKVEFSTTGAWAGEEVEVASDTLVNDNWSPLGNDVIFLIEHLVMFDGMVANSEFRIEITAITDTYGKGVSVDPETVTWQGWEIEEQDIESYPTCVAFYEQRLVFANYRHNAQLIRLGRTGDFYNFDQSTPLKEDDSFDLVLAAKSLDAIKHLVPGKSLAALTGAGEWLARGPEGLPLTPVSFDVKNPSAHGSGDAKALKVSDALIYAADRGRTIREMLLDNFGAANDAPRDLGIMVEHLFRDNSVKELQWSDKPFGVLWALRDDGVLLGLTYMREHQIYAWHHHDTGGVYDDDGSPVHQIESICAIPENDESRLYMIVNRTIDGSTVRYVEAFASRRVVESEDAVFSDSALSVDGRNTDGTTTLRITSYQGTHDGGNDSSTLSDSDKESWVTDEWQGDAITNSTTAATGTIDSNTTTDITATMSGGVPDDEDWDDGDDYVITPDWTANKKLSLIASAATFVAGDVGKQIEVRRTVLGTAQDDSGRITRTVYSCRVLVIGYESDTVLEVVPQTAVPTQLQSYDSTEWGRASNSFSGLDHLEGETVSVLVDGATHQDLTVSLGEITLDTGIYAERLVVGIPYTSELITLPLDIPGDAGSIRMSAKTISAVGMELDQYRGVYVGHKRDKLTPAQQRAVSDAYETIDPENTLVVLRPESSWKRLVNVIVQQRDPLPVTVLSMLVEFQVGGQ